MVCAIDIHYVEDLAIIFVRGKGNTGLKGRSVKGGVPSADVPAVLKEMVDALEQELDSAELL